MTYLSASIEQVESSFVTLSQAIQETFKAIDRFEWQACDELKNMRDNKIFIEGGYPTFEKYCETELFQWGGYRRVSQLIAAKQVIDSLKGTEYDGVVKRESHARPLLKLVKTPEKLKEAVAIAIEHNPQPIAEDFKKAVLTIVPPKEQKPKSKEQLFLKDSQNPDSCVVTAEHHPRYGQQGTIVSEPNDWQKIVEFPDSRVTIATRDLLIGENTPPPKTYTEEQLQQAIEEAKQGFYSELQTSAQTQVNQELAAYQQAIQQRDERITHLQQQVEQLRSLQQLEQKNQQLRDRIGELERALEERPSQSWGDTFTKQAEKVLNAQVQQTIESLEPEFHLRSLSISTPNNVDECLQLMGMALSNIAIAMNNAQLAQAAALLEQVIEPASEHEQLIKEAVAEIQSVLSRNCTWDEFLSVAQEFEQIKDDYWKELPVSDRSRINQLKHLHDELQAFAEKYQIRIGDWVSGSDIYDVRSTYKGIVENIKPSSEYVHVVWKFGNFVKERDFFEPKDLKVIPEPQQEAA